MKGFLYTIAAFLLISLFLFVMINESKIRESRIIHNLERNRVLAVNDFVYTVEEDLKRGIKISGTHAIASLISYISYYGKYSNNASQDLKTLIYNGTINNTSIEAMEESNLNYWIKKINEVASYQGISSEIRVTELRVYQEDPWHVLINVTVSLKIEDMLMKACNFSKIDYFQEKVSILDLEDPIYLISTNGSITNKIEKSKYENNFTKFLYSGNFNSSSESLNEGDWIYGNISCIGEDMIIQNSSSLTLYNVSKCIDYSGVLVVFSANKSFEVWDIKNLKRHTYRNFTTTQFGGSYYTYSPYAPSFLQRLEGNFSSSNCCGIESLVNIEYIQEIENGRFVKDNVAIQDYLYWKNENYEYKVKGMPPWFALLNSEDIYNISSSLKE